MSAWWWVPIGLAAWLSVSLAVGLLLARFFRRAAQARDALDALTEEKLAERQEPPEDGPRVALRSGMWMTLAARQARPSRKRPAWPASSAA